MTLKWRWLPTAIVGGWLSYRWLGRLAVPPQPLVTRRTDVIYEQTPTLFIPGWGGNAWTYNRLLRWLARQGYGHKILTVRVDWDGNPHFIGCWEKAADNPLIQVLFDHNLTRDYQPQVTWITTILRTLNHRYGVTSYNLVAHSWGGSAAMHSVILHGQHPGLPHLRRLVLLGAPFDEQRSGGRPDAAYERLRAARHRLESWQGGQVINVYGTLSGRLTDGSVPVRQVQALRAILAGSPLQYREFHVDRTSHGQLQALTRMWRLIGQAVWGIDKKNRQP